LLCSLVVCYLGERETTQAGGAAAVQGESRLPTEQEARRGAQSQDPGIIT